MRNVVPRGSDVRLGATGVLVALLAVAAIWFAFPDTRFDLPAGDRAPLTWWMLATLFAVTETCVLQIPFRRQKLSLTLGAVPLLLGLFLTGPGALLLASGLGALAVPAVLGRIAPAKAMLRLGLTLGGTALAALTFQLVTLLLPGDGDRFGVLGCAGALLAVVLAGCFEVLVPAQLRAGTQRLQKGHRRRLLRQAAVVAAASGGLTLVPLLVFAHSQGARLTALTGAICLMVYGAITKLNNRHASLERLYVLSDTLAAAPTYLDVVRSVLQQSATLLRADYAEVMITGIGPGVQLWSVRQGSTVYGPVEPGTHHRTLPFPPSAPRVVRGGSGAEREFLLARSLREAAVVPIRIEGPVIGQLLVGDRVGQEGGFAGQDLRLLETVANHAGVALRNSRLIQQLHFEARHDELTRLPNRLFFRGLLDEATEALSRGVPCAVMMLDFNGFKAINDSLGHAAGDELLQVLAGRFHQAMAGRATVARLGGDEFAVLASGVDGREAATALADRLLSAFEEPVEIGGTRLRVGGSLGIALGPSHARTGAELMRMADVAMYVAKSGAGGSRVYSAELAPQSREVLTLATDLRDALVGNEIGILVQPVVRLDSLAIQSLEALARWTHPVLGEVAPGVFFAAAERSGQTVALSQRVLDCALAACRSWRDEGNELRISVNMATSWLNNSALPEQIGLALERHGVPAEMLCLEIKESSVMDDPRRCLEVLTELRAMGVRLSVDDFGTGYSSLTYLGRLPVNQIKIDESFTQLVAKSDRDRAIVRSIVDLGRNLGMEVVAEGVVDATTRRLLAEMGCRYGQGYLFSRPIEPREVSGLLDRIRTVGWPIAQREVPTPEPPAVAPMPNKRGSALPTVVSHLDTVQSWPTPQQQPSRRI